MQLKQDLVSMGIPASDIIVESKSRNTHENAHQTRLVFEEKGFSKQNNLLITSSMHMRRALACFAKEGLSCTPFTTDHYSIHSETIAITEFIPSNNAFTMWDKLIKEWVGYTMYNIMGYL